jgi:hypothetical protein
MKRIKKDMAAPIRKALVKKAYIAAGNKFLVWWQKIN